MRNLTIAVAALCAAAGASAQPAEPGVQAAEPIPTSSATPATPDVATPPAADQSATPAPPAGAPPPVMAPVVPPDAPLVNFVSLTAKPEMVDSTPAKAAFAMVGAFAMIAAGEAIVEHNHIPNPASDVAADITKSYAAAHSYRLADAPIVADKASPKIDVLASSGQGARYLVVADSPGMNLIYFSFDWAHFDLLFLDRVRIIDTSSQKVVAQSKCFIKTHKRPGLLTHDELLADNAAALKQLIKDKAAECSAKMKADLKI